MAIEPLGSEVQPRGSLYSQVRADFCEIWTAGFAVAEKIVARCPSIALREESMDLCSFLVRPRQG